MKIPDINIGSEIYARNEFSAPTAPSLPTPSLREVVNVRRPFFPPLICLISALLVIFLAVLLPVGSEPGRYLAVPGSGLPMVTSPLSSGHLYKLVVKGTVGFSLNGKSDALYTSCGGKFNIKNPIVSIQGEIPEPDIAYPQEHIYIYYIPGRGESVEVSLVDGGGIISLLGVQYLDNSGKIYAVLEEADFRSWIVQDADYVSQEVVVGYTLDPVPAGRDNIHLRVYDSGGELVFEVSSRGEIGYREGSPHALSKETVGEFIWYGWGNVGRFNSPRPLPPGEYTAVLVFEREGEEFLAFPPNSDRQEMEIAVTHAMSGTFPKLIGRHLGDGSIGFPYDTSRGIKQIQSFPDGIDDIYTRQKGEGDDFLYYGTRGPWLPFGEVAPACIGSLQRTLNLIRGAHWEFYEAGKGMNFPELVEITSVYDDHMAEMVEWYQSTFSVDAKKEREILLRFDNLPPEYNYEPTKEELSYIIAGDTLKAILNTTFDVPKMPVPITLKDLDNLPAYDAENPHYSLYHLFEEIGRRANSRRNYTPQPSSGGLQEGVIYDISDDAFVSLLIAIGYQESGLAHISGSGRIYRAGKGRGSATGYMQMTADVIGATHYVMTFWDGDELVSKRLGEWTFKERYFLRNINRCNIEMAAQFLKEMFDNCGGSRFDERFRQEMKLGGMLDATSKKGLLRRAKLAGSSYNAGPEATRVMIIYLYDDPETEENESVGLFFGECDGDMELYLKKFREDLVAHIIGDYKFPLESTVEGRERFNKLIKWLGPYWHKKVEGISWEEAALMKLDREVIGYCHNIAVNLPGLMRGREAIFKNKTFYMLLVAKEEEEEEPEQEEITIPNSTNNNNIPMKPTDGVMPPKKQ